MSQVKVLALCGMEHNGTKKRGDKFTLSKHSAMQLAMRGMVEIIRDEEESKKKESTPASPAAEASPKQTVKKSKSGGKKKPTNKDSS